MLNTKASKLEASHAKTLDPQSQSKKITLYAHPNTRSTRVSWMLEELEVDYHFQLVDFSKGESRSEAFLSINPAGKIPVLVTEEGGALLESGAILNHLAEKYAFERLIPGPATYERAIYDQWTYFVLSELEQPLWTMGKHKFALPKEYRVAEVRATAAWEFQKALKLLSEGLADHEYIMGQCGTDWDRFTAADILICHTLIWGRAFQQPIEQRNLIDYLQRNSDRSAFKRAVAREAGPHRSLSELDSLS